MRGHFIAACNMAAKSTHQTKMSMCNACEREFHFSVTVFAGKTGLVFNFMQEINCDATMKLLKEILSKKELSEKDLIEAKAKLPK